MAAAYSSSVSRGGFESFFQNVRDQRPPLASGGAPGREPNSARQADIASSVRHLPTGLAGDTPEVPPGRWFARSLCLYFMLSRRDRPLQIDESAPKSMTDMGRPWRRRPVEFLAYRGRTT